MGNVARQAGTKGAARKGALRTRVASARVARSLGVPLGKGSVVSLAIARIADALLRKALRPGDYLPSETELAKTLGIGKSSVREAVKMLQAIGVVEVRRGQGAVVRRHPGPDYLSPLVIRIGETNFQLFKPSISVSADDASPTNEVV